MKIYKLILLFAVLLLLNGFSDAQCIKGDCENGFGEKIYPDSSRFIGEFENGGKKNGTYFYANDDVYKGSFENNLRSGFASYSYKNGDTFEGIFVNDKKGYGRYLFKNGNVYTGTFDKNKFDGYGTLTSKTGNNWEGLWEKGKKVWGGSVNFENDNISVDSIPPLNDELVEKVTVKGKAPRIFAVVVGIADYEGSLADLQYSDDDARLFFNHLHSALPSEMAAGKSVLLLNRDATLNNITNALQSIFSLSTENDFIIFYFSGHGSPGSFCPTDYTQQLLNHSVVRNFFVKSKARYRVCIADACFSGSIGNGDNAFTVPSAMSEFSDSRLAVIMSSKPNQTSLETSRLQQGVFSYYLVNGLKGKADLNNDSYITMGELFIYTKSSVAHSTNGDQVPVVFGKELNRIPLTRIKR